MACKRSAVRSRLSPPNLTRRFRWHRKTEFSSGGIAQLGERLHGMQEVSGSIPLISTKFSKMSLLKLNLLRRIFFRLFFITTRLRTRKTREASFSPPVNFSLSLRGGEENNRVPARLICVAITLSTASGAVSSPVLRAFSQYPEAMAAIAIQLRNQPALPVQIGP